MYMYAMANVQDMTKLFTSRFPGNEALHEITFHGNYTLNIVLTDWTRVTKIAEYNIFRIGSESDGYRLTVGGYSGDAGMYYVSNESDRYCLSVRGCSGYVGGY